MAGELGDGRSAEGGPGQPPGRGGQNMLISTESFRALAAA